MHKNPQCHSALVTAAELLTKNSTPTVPALFWFWVHIQQYSGTSWDAGFAIGKVRALSAACPCRLQQITELNTRNFAVQANYTQHISNHTRGMANPAHKATPDSFTLMGLTSFSERTPGHLAPAVPIP